MAIAIRGLRLRPTYEDLINVAVSGKLYIVKFPNRDAQFLRNGFVLSQLDGEGQRAMERQQEMASKEAYKEHLLKEIAKNTVANFHDLRNNAHQELRTERVNNAVHFNISQGDDDMGDDISSVDFGTQTGETGVQADMRPSTRVGMAQATTSMDETGTQTSRVKSSNRPTQTSSPIVEDRTEEIERLKDEQEARIREMQRSNEIRLSNIINQVRGETTREVRYHTMGEAEQIHQQVMTDKVNEIEFRNAQRMRAMQLEYEQKLLEMAQDNNLTKRQAKQIIQETEERARAEAEQYVGHIGSWFEQQAAHERKQKEQANERAKKAETEARKAEHTNQRTPDNRPTAKQRAGPSPPRQLPVIPPFPTGEQASGSQDNPESQHEPTGRRGRPRKNPAHDAPYDDNTDVKYWMNQNVQYLRIQLFKRGLDPNQAKRPNNKPWTKPQYQAWMRDWLAKEAKKNK